MSICSTSNINGDATTAPDEPVGFGSAAVVLDVVAPVVPAAVVPLVPATAPDAVIGAGAVPLIILASERT